MKYVLLLCVFSVVGSAADVTIIGNDGSRCSMAKRPGTSMVLTVGCVSKSAATGALSGAAGPTLVQVAIDDTPFVYPLGIGTRVTCLLVGNTTAFPITQGDLGEIQPHSLNWACADGTGTEQQGSFTWP